MNYVSHIFRSIGDWRQRPRRRLFSNQGQWRTACSTAILGGAGLMHGAQLTFSGDGKLWTITQGIGLMLIASLALGALGLYASRPATLPDPKW